MEDKRMNEIEEIEATEVDETQDSSNAGARCKEAGGSR